MKLIQGLLGCALAVGLTASTLQADTVFGNTVYTPLNLKLKVQYNDSKGVVHEANVTSKDILQLLGYPKGDQLATAYDGFGHFAEVFVINKNGIVANLTSQEIFSISFNQLVNKQNKDGKNGSFSVAEKGVVTLNFDFIGFVTNSIVAQEVPNGEVSFTANGVYLWQSNGGAIKNGDQKIATKLTTSSFVGDGFGTNVAPTVKANAAITGNGDFLIKDGTSDGIGGGTVFVD